MRVSGESIQKIPHSRTMDPEQVHRVRPVLCSDHAQVEMLVGKSKCRGWADRLKLWRPTWSYRDTFWNGNGGDQLQENVQRQKNPDKESWETQLFNCEPEEGGAWNTGVERTMKEGKIKYASVAKERQYFKGNWLIASTMEKSSQIQTESYFLNVSTEVFSELW